MADGAIFLLVGLRFPGVTEIAAFDLDSDLSCDSLETALDCAAVLLPIEDVDNLSRRLTGKGGAIACCMMLGPCIPKTLPEKDTEGGMSTPVMLAVAERGCLGPAVFPGVAVGK